MYSLQATPIGRGILFYNSETSKYKIMKKFTQNSDITPNISWKFHWDPIGIFLKTQVYPLFYLGIKTQITAQVHGFLPASGDDSEELRYPSSYVNGNTISHGFFSMKRIRCSKVPLHCFAPWAVRIFQLPHNNNTDKEKHPSFAYLADLRITCLIPCHEFVFMTKSRRSSASFANFCLVLEQLN